MAYPACVCVGVAIAIDAGVDASFDAPPPSIASCKALPSTCGASQNDSCCHSLDVAGGTYFRSYDKAADAIYSDMSSPATLSSFRLDKYDVTVGRFRAFLAEGFGTQANPPSVAAGTHAHIAGSGWQASWNPSLAADTAALVAA
jgi:formylglycine-generating enzyme